MERRRPIAILKRQRENVHPLVLVAALAPAGNCRRREWRRRRRERWRERHGDRFVAALRPDAVRQLDLSAQVGRRVPRPFPLSNTPPCCFFHTFRQWRLRELLRAAPRPLLAPRQPFQRGPPQARPGPGKKVTYRTPSCAPRPASSGKTQTFKKVHIGPQLN
eukprot:5291018-Prymnesium_polylepis.2